MSTWLATIVTNSALTQLRKRSRQTHLSLNERFGRSRNIACQNDWRTAD
jgi:DNA-directed RNA polymerase specialized sigma24 family protein